MGGIQAREGKVYCCAVLDTYSRRVVGWSIDASPNAALVTNALGMAIDTRLTKRGPTGTVGHPPTFQLAQKGKNGRGTHQHHPSRGTVPQATTVSRRTP